MICDKVSFEYHSNGNIYYIFVLHSEKKNNFLILPFHEVEKKVHEKTISEVRYGKRYGVNIEFRDEKVYLGNEIKITKWDISSIIGI